MGGFGSGRRLQSKNTTDDYRQLDERKLQKEGLLEPGRSFTRQWKFGNKIIRTINIRAEINKIILSYKQRLNSKESKYMSYPVWLDWTWCNYGNYRAWFLCPIKDCGRRVAILYDGTVFACRHCYQLSYSCQREDYIDRKARRADRIRRRLGWKEGILNPIDVKPRSMHRKTFEKLSDQHNYYCSASLNGMLNQLGMRD